MTTRMMQSAFATSTHAVREDGGLEKCGPARHGPFQVSGWHPICLSLCQSALKFGLAKRLVQKLHVSLQRSPWNLDPSITKPSVSWRSSSALSAR